MVREDADEYDPGRPNDYEELRKSREVQRKEAELEVGRQERLRLEALRQEVRGTCLQHLVVRPCRNLFICV